MRFTARVRANVFGWTADEARSFELLDAFVDAGFQCHRHRRCLFPIGRAKYEGPLRDLAIRAGQGVIAYYSLASGFLAGKYRATADLERSPRGRAVTKYLTPRGLRLLDALDEVGPRHDAKPAEVALAWLIGPEGVTAPIAGATTVAQLASFSKAAEMRLIDEDMRVRWRRRAPPERAGAGALDVAADATQKQGLGGAPKRHSGSGKTRRWPQMLYRQSLPGLQAPGDAAPNPWRPPTGLLRHPTA